MMQFVSSLRARSIAFVLLAVVPAFGVILFTDQKYHDSIGTQVQKNALGSVRVITTEQRRIFENAHQLLITLSRLPQVREHNAASCQKLLSGLLEPLYADLGVVDPKGSFVCSARGAANFSRPAEINSDVRHVAETRDFSVGSIRKNGAPGKTVITLFFPVTNPSGSLQSIAFVDLDYSWIVRATAKHYLPPDASFALFDEHGTVALKYFENSEASSSQGETFVANGKSAFGVEGHIESIGQGAITQMVTYRQLDHRIGGKIMYAAIEIPTRTAFAETERILRQNLMVLGILTAFTLLAAWFGADLFVLRRIRDLMSATKALAAGNLKARTRLPYGASELGHLARTFDDLATTLDQRAAEAKLAELEIQKQNLRQSAIHKISAAMASRLNIGNVLQALIDGVANLFPFGCITLSWVDDKGNLNLSGSASETERGILGSVAEQETGLPQEVFRLKSPLLIGDLGSDPQSSNLVELREAGFIAYFGLPIAITDRDQGVLSLYAVEAIDLSKEDQEFLADLAHQAAVALHNSRLYEQTKKQAGDLEKSNRIKDEFLGVMSHELRTPINVIMNCSEAMNMGVFGEMTPALETATEKIRIQSSHLLSLINGILEITKIETGVVSVTVEPIDVYQLTAELQSDYAFMAKEKSVSLNWHIANDLSQISADRMKLRQVLINLVNNAIKFTDEGSVEVSFHRIGAQGEVEITVKDTGIGIPDELLPRIFEKFHQIDSSTTRNYGGAGLGLYVVKSFVDAMGGTLSVQSKPNEGTTFIVHLPANSDAQRVEYGVTPGNVTAPLPDPCREGEF
jgi:signal transduction histidine kinase